MIAPSNYDLHPLLTDVGLVQVSAMEEDPAATLVRLEEFLPFKDDLLDRLATTLCALDCGLVLADISPLGIAAARHARIPSVLIENFTWDWIYEAYVEDHPAFEAQMAAFARIFAGADLRIQTTPVCRASPAAVAVEPVSRAPRTAPDEVRRRLGVPPDFPVVLVTMGGIPWRHPALDELESSDAAIFLIPGITDGIERRGNLLAVPHRSGFFHPDLVHASDAVVGKLGYSTLAETYAAGVPFAYIPRPVFRESGPLAAFVAERMSGLALTPLEFESGSWRARIPELLALRRSPGRENGAFAAACRIGLES